MGESQMQEKYMWTTIRGSPKAAESRTYAHQRTNKKINGGTDLQRLCRSEKAHMSTTGQVLVEMLAYWCSNPKKTGH